MKSDHSRDVLQEFLNVWNFEEKYLIYGTSTTAGSLLKKLGGKLKIAGFMDSNEKVWGSVFEEYPVFSLEEWKQRYKALKIIVASGAYTEIRDMLIKEGLQEQKDFCDSRYFVGCYFAAVYNKVYLYRTDISITERCNLRCRKCNMLMPYYKEPKHKTFESIKEDIDIFFRWVDNLQILNLLGGEPFLHPDVEEITRYICEKYSDKIEQVEFFTNGLVRLTDSMLDVIQKYDIHIQVSDYRKGIPPVSARIDEFIQKLEERNIVYRRNIDNKWLNFGFPNYRNDEAGEEQMIQFFDKCYSPFRGLNDKKLYYCHLNTSAVCAGLFEDNHNDYFDLESYEEDRKKELVKFDLGYTESGYITYCRRCKGCFAVNEEYTDVAEQMKK